MGDTEYITGNHPLPPAGMEISTEYTLPTEPPQRINNWALAAGTRRLQLQYGVRSTFSYPGAIDNILGTIYIVIFQLFIGSCKLFIIFKVYHSLFVRLVKLLILKVQEMTILMIRRGRRKKKKKL